MEFNVQVRNPQKSFGKSLLNKLAQAANRLEQEVETELKVSFALTFSQFRVLEGLLSLGEVSQRELAKALGVTPAVVTRQAEALSSRGLLVQRPNPRSKRENLLALSRKGEQAAFDAGKIVVEQQKRVFEPLSLQQETALERALDAIIKTG
jgi:DNA-binding MarR family transcriptional regulator